MDPGPSIGCDDEHQVVLPAQHAHTTATLLRTIVLIEIQKQRGRRGIKKKQQRKTERQERNIQNKTLKCIKQKSQRD
jgi:hypothetical protein